MKATRYVVLERGSERGPDAVFLRDRFHFVAFLLPFLWLAAHRLYVFALLAFMVQAGLFVLGRVEGFGLAAAILPILFGAAVALEGPRLVAWRLRRRGWREAEIVHAADLEEAELLYYGTAGPAFDEPAAPAHAQVPEPASVPAPSRDLPHLGWRSARTLLDTGAR